MTASPPAFPGSRTLAEWWRQLASRQPRALWVGHLLLHRVEALTRRTQSVPFEPLQRLVLQGVTLYPDEPLPALAQRLHLESPLLGRLLHGLAAAGLTRPAPGWLATDRGRAALAQGAYPQTSHERRGFYFADSNGRTPPHFLPLPDRLAQPTAPLDDWKFDVQHLLDCVRRPPEWKERFGFPADVLEVVHAERVPGIEPWQQVIFDRPERLRVVLAPAGARLLGFSYRPEVWELQTEAPVLSLGPGWEEVFPPVAAGVAPDVWQSAWQAWCAEVGLADAVADTRSVTIQGHKLQIAAAPQLLEHLRSIRHEVLEEAIWLLAGDGPLRAAAVVELREA